MTTTRLRWGIIGTGLIAGVFAAALPRSRSGQAQAVASREASRAAAFATRHGIPTSHDSYAALCADPLVDAIYIATPHTQHHAEALMALRAGKHVLVEKPFAICVADAEEISAVAAACGRQALEAFMYRVHPQSLRLQEVVRSGAIGAVTAIRSCFTFGMGDEPNIRLRKDLYGGALWDVGCYCVNASRWLADAEPVSVHGTACIEGHTGVDAQTAAVLRFPSGIVAHFDVGIRSTFSSWIEVLGRKGRIVVPSPWKPDAKRTTFTVESAQGTHQEVITDGGDIYALEADHLAAVIDGASSPLSGGSAIANTRVLAALWQQIHA